MEENLFHPFILPFSLGVVVLFVTLIYKFTRWFIMLDRGDKQLIARSIFTKASIDAIADVIREALLHLKIFKQSKRLGYMHFSLAFGWFLLIVVGKIETTDYLKDGLNLPHLHVFFRYFFPNEGERFVHYINYKFVMDLLLLFVLSGVTLAWLKRFNSKKLGMKRSTKHTPFDKLALSALWLIFPLRLLAESVTCGIYKTGSFLTNSLGDVLEQIFSLELLEMIEIPAWTLYSLSLGLFFIAMPFSRYMHIFAEIPHIFLKRYKVTIKERESAIDNFQIQACSRCGICIDPCQMQREADVNNIQAVYFLRDRRYSSPSEEVTQNCLMCGKCENVCPVGIDLTALRANTRVKLFNEIKKAQAERLGYISEPTQESVPQKIGFFAGCMTSLTPSITTSMERIFSKAGADVWFADRDGGVCCGRPMAMAGDLEGATKMRSFNRELFQKAGITTLVTSCPICLREFKEKYQLEGIELLHHSQYILNLIKEGRISPDKSEKLYTYHDPCELGRGLKIYEEPREVISSVGKLVELPNNREKGDCCGYSLGNNYASSAVKYKISNDLKLRFAATGGELITSCPLCKKSLKSKDIAELF